MTESRILELLLQNGNTCSHLPKLSPQCVQNISQCVSNILYNSLTSNSASQANYRLDMLLLLRKWFNGQKHNFQIDVTNYNCLIDSLVESKIEYASIVDNMHTVTEPKYSKTKPLNITTEVIQHCMKQQELHTRQVKHREIIQSRDERKCNNVNFSYCNPFSSKISELYNTSNRLILIRDEISCKETNQDVEMANEKQFMQESINKPREKQIQMAWSLLNLDKSVNDFILLSRILLNLNSYKKLFSHEIEFINYLWQNWESLQITPDLILTLLEKFPFVYEREIIKLCKDILLEENVIDTTTKIKEIKKLLEISKSSKQLLCNIKSIFYELYAYSNYNNKLFQYLHLLENVE